MPYIPRHKRLDAGEHPTTPGELNYAITALAWRYTRSRGQLTYATINDVMGALAGAQAEYYRRVAVPYEDEKIVEHGDVFL